MKAAFLARAYGLLRRMTLALAFFVISNTSFSQGRILINEYLSWPANACSVTSEYIELYNFGPGPVNIGCYILTDGDYSITIPPNTIVQPGQYFVIAGQNNLPLGCANGNVAVTANLNWNTCNCTSAPIPTNGDGLMTDGGGGSEQLVLFDASLRVVDAIVRDLSETASPITTSTVGGQCSSFTFDLDTMNISYERVGESQGRANSFARRIDGGCGWLKDPQQSGGATNNTPGAVSDLNAALAVTSTVTCTNTGAAVVTVSSGDYSQIFPMKYTLAKDVDSNGVFSFADAYSYGVDSSAHTVPVGGLTAGIYRIVVETKNGCDLRTFNFNILGCGSSLLDVDFEKFDVVVNESNVARLSWTVGDRNLVKSFIIQRSDDGFDFRDQATITNAQDPRFDKGYFFEDRIQDKTTHYRIVFLRKDGTVVMSKINNARPTIQDGDASFYPNPFTRNFTVSITGTQSEPIIFSLYDGFGKLVRTTNAVIHTGRNTIVIETKSLHPGSYFLRYHNGSGTIAGVARLLKIASE